MDTVCFFRHALALDERQVKFIPEYAYGAQSLPARLLKPTKPATAATAAAAPAEGSTRSVSLSLATPDSLRHEHWTLMRQSSPIRTGGRPRRGRGGGKRKGERPTKTAADLDAEMEVRFTTPVTFSSVLISFQDYTAANAAPAVAA